MSPAAVRIKDLSFGWHPDQPVLNISELTILRGEHIYIKGPSGSGKSTLLGILSCIQTRYSGQVDILGQSIAQLNLFQRDRFRADHFGYIFQQFNLLPYLSVLENTLLALRFSKYKRRKLANTQQAHESARAILDALQLPQKSFNWPVHRLSVGQQQRVACARALLGQPDIILADEPTSALDIDAQLAFMALLLDICRQQNNTLIFVSHDIRLESQFKTVVDFSVINQVRA